MPLDWAMTQNNLGNALWTLGRAGERDGAAGGGGGGLSRGAGGIGRASAAAARLGGDAEQPRQRAPDARRAGERDGAVWRRRSRPIVRRWRKGRASACRSNGRRRRTTSATRSRRSASARAGRRGWRRRSRPIARRWRKGRASACRSTGRRRRTTSAPRSRGSGERESGTARLEEAVAAYRAALEERTRERVPLDWATTQNNLGTALSTLGRAGERDGAAGGGGRGLSRGAGGKDARARAARLGGDAEQSRHRALDARASGRAGRRGWRRRSRPIARRWRNARASACRSNGR